jgi:hypothetical protein
MCNFPTLLRKSHLCIPFLGISRPKSQFQHSCVYEQLIYSQDGPHISCSRIGRLISHRYMIVGTLRAEH